MDVKKDVLFLDEIMDVVQNVETSALFTSSVIKLKKFVIQVVSVCGRKSK